jgi:hypothetical protein
MFIRQKMIANKPYAYLVRSKWDKRSKKVKQKVSKYLGKIQTLDRIRNTSFSEYYHVDVDEYVLKHDLHHLVRDLVELEFYRHGFIKKNTATMINGENEVDIEKLETVYAMNEGFMNKNTLRQIFKYDRLLDEREHKIPYKFAALFVNAGIDLDKELFIALYQKYFSDSLSSEDEE